MARVFGRKDKESSESQPETKLPDAPTKSELLNAVAPLQGVEEVPPGGDIKEAVSATITSHGGYMLTPPMTLLPPKTFDDFADELKRLHSLKQEGYGTSPLDELSVSAWKYQVQIKATRAVRATTPEKLEDELLDTAVYCLLLLEKIAKEK